MQPGQAGGPLGRARPAGDTAVTGAQRETCAGAQTGPATTATIPAGVWRIRCADIFRPFRKHTMNFIIWLIIGAAILLAIVSLARPGTAR